MRDTEPGRSGPVGFHTGQGKVGWMCRQTRMLRMTGRCPKTNALVSEIVLMPRIFLTAGISLTTLESGILLNLLKRFETVFRPVYRFKNFCNEKCLPGTLRIFGIEALFCFCKDVKGTWRILPIQCQWKFFPSFDSLSLLFNLSSATGRKHAFP